MPTCYTKKKKDGSNYTTCLDGQKKKSKPSKPSVPKMRRRTVTPMLPNTPNSYSPRRSRSTPITPLSSGSYDNAMSRDSSIDPFADSPPSSIDPFADSPDSQEIDGLTPDSSIDPFADSPPVLKTRPPSITDEFYDTGELKSYEPINSIKYGGPLLRMTNAGPFAEPNPEMKAFTGMSTEEANAMSPTSFFAKAFGAVDKSLLKKVLLPSQSGVKLGQKVASQDHKFNQHEIDTAREAIRSGEWNRREQYEEEEDWEAYGPYGESGVEDRRGRLGYKGHEHYIERKDPRSRDIVTSDRPVLTKEEVEFMYNNYDARDQTHHVKAEAIKQKIVDYHNHVAEEHLVDNVKEFYGISGGGMTTEEDPYLYTPGRQMEGLVDTIHANLGTDYVGGLIDEDPTTGLWNHFSDFARKSFKDVRAGFRHDEGMNQTDEMMAMVDAFRR